MKFVQYEPQYCEEAAEEYKRDKDAMMRKWDTSHDVSVIYDDGTVARAATFKHAEWAGKFQKMMNEETQ